MSENNMLYLRKKHNMRQADVAARLGVGRTTYIGYENGDILPPLDKVWKLADLYQTTIDNLVGRATKG